MQKPSKRHRKTLERAVTLFEQSISEANTYLVGRGISVEAATAARLGVVVGTDPVYQRMLGRLAIPYIDYMGVYALKFRCLTHDDCSAENCTKYLALPGQEMSLYSVTDVDLVCDTIHITEGELDQVVLKQVFPADGVVGVPGASMWQPHWHMHFGGFERVLVWADGDKAGQDLANKIRKEVRAAEQVPVPRGLDVTDLFLLGGADGLRAIVGDDGEDTD